MFRLFFEVQYHNNKVDLNKIFPDSVHDCSALHVCSFILSILHQGIFSVSAFIVSVIYLSRFKESSHITLHACTWRPLFLTSLLLADKMWEDKPVRNSSLAKLFPVLNNRELNRMESEFLGEIRFNVLVKPDLFCSFCEKLLAEQVHAEIARCVSTSEYAATLQADDLEAGQPKPFGNLKPFPEASTIKPGDMQTPTGSEDGQEAASNSSSAYNHARPVARVAQVPTGWIEGQDAVSAHSSDASGSRSHSAGPTACGGSRREQPRVVGDSRGPTLRSSSGGVCKAAPFNRSDSQRKPVVGSKVRSPFGDGDDGSVSDKSIRPPGPVPSMACTAAGPTQRRSMPAKTNGVGYQPLARAPSTGSNLSGGTTVSGTCGGAGSVVSGATSASSTAPVGTPIVPMGTVMAGGSVLGGGSVSPKLRNHEPAQRAAQVQPPPGEHGFHPYPSSHHHHHHQVGIGGTGRYTIGGMPQHSVGACMATPPVPMGDMGPPGSMAQAQHMAKQRGAHIHAMGSGAQPCRALSAPRVSGMAAHSHHGHMASSPGHGGSSNIRTSSQPMQATYTRHEQRSAAPSPGSPALGATSVVGGYAPGSGQPSYSSSVQSASAPSSQTAPSAQARGSSVQSMVHSNVSVPGQVRGVISSGCGGGGASSRNPSQTGSTSSQGGVPQSTTTMRGRSPAPAPGGNVMGGIMQVSGRQPRAATPTSCMKGVAPPGSTGMVGVPRTSFGSGPVVVPRGGTVGAYA